jgi:hypothetical protein
MGQMKSKSIKHNKVAEELEKDIMKMMTEYKIWADINICQKLEVIYYDKIIKFHQKDLLDISSGIGLVYNDKIDKEELCKIIIQNFKIRIEILKLIYETILYSKEKLNRLYNGPVCKKVDKYIDDFINCNNNNGEWVTEYKQLLKQIDQSENLGKYNKHKRDYLKTHEEYIKELTDTFKKLKDDIGHTMNIKDLLEIKNKTLQSIRGFKHLTSVLYLLMVNFS